MEPMGPYSAVCARCAQHFPYVASQTEMRPMGCLCFGILQCAVGVRSIFRMTKMEPTGCLCFGILQCALGVRISVCRESGRNGTNGFVVLRFSAVCARSAQHVPYVASLTEMECFGILQCALGVRSIFRMPRV
jgi:hypothetical protein